MFFLLAFFYAGLIEGFHDDTIYPEFIEANNQYRSTVNTRVRRHKRIKIVLT